MIRQLLRCVGCSAMALAIAGCQDGVAPATAAPVKEMPQRPAQTLFVRSDLAYDILHGTVRLYNMRLQPLNGSGPSEDGLGSFAVAPGSSLRVTGNWEIGPITDVDECQFCSYIVVLFAGGSEPLVTKTSPVLNPNVGESGAIDRTFRAGLPSAGTYTVGAGYQLGDTFDPAGQFVFDFPGAVSGSYDVRGPWTQPAITGTLGTNGWYTSDVGVSWPLTEPEGYPVIEKTGCDPVTISADVDGQTFTCSLTSKMGTGTFPLTIKRDATKPTLAPTAPSSVDLGAVVSATPNAGDALSGLASETCGPMPTSQAGTFSVECTASDKAGNTATKSLNYVVLSPYQFGGFQSPIDPTKTNSVTAGRAVPVTFSLGGNKGLAILAAGSPSSRTLACSASAPATTIVETTAATSGGGGLTYDAATDTYTYVWKTEKSWAGTCRTLVLKLTDNVEHTVNFKFSK